MSNFPIVFESIRNGKLIDDLNTFTREQLEPYLPYLWSLTSFCESGYKNDYSGFLVCSFYIFLSITKKYL